MSISEDQKKAQKALDHYWNCKKFMGDCKLCRAVEGFLETLDQCRQMEEPRQ